MAHYKRGYPRAASRGQKLDKWKAKKLGDEFHWLYRWPRWWDVVHHRRPPRRRATAVKRAVFLGKIDPDAAIWPVNKKPHTYYW